jgi:hypothetical protein
VNTARFHANAKRHCRCTSKACGKRFKGVPGLTKCPACERVGRLDRWANAKPWRALTCHCDAYHFPHRRQGGCCFGPRVWPNVPGLVGLPF